MPFSCNLRAVTFACILLLHIVLQGYGNTPESDDAAPYCCPTPPVEPDQCSSGAVTKTAYVRDEIR